MSGAAQFGGVGYDPATRGTFFGKLRARWPYYAGRALRVVQGELEGGALVNTRTRNFILTEMTGSEDGRTWTFEAKDILALADDEKAVCPKPSRGALAAGITDVATTLTLTPAGEGAASYPASGRAVIGSELVSYTRSGDVLTLTGRGLSGTKAAAHSAGDAVQQTFSPVAMRIDDALEILLRDYAGVPTAYIPKAKWVAEITRWMPQVLLTTDVCSPTGVAKLIAELSILGIAVWWDDVAQEIGLRATRPVDGESVKLLSDAANIKAITFEDREKDRITEVMFFSVQLDPTKAANSTDNYARVTLTPDLEAKGVNAFNDTKIRKVYCRWLNQGADAVITVISKRVLNRFAKQPIRARVHLDQKDGAISLVDVLEVQTGAFQDATGASGNRRMQAIGIADLVPGHEIEVTAQDFDFNSKYGYATENTRPAYTLSTPAQKLRGMYACDNTTLKMSNGDEPYRAI
ncbi:hypothetical protein HYN69_10550 [Gemmobacter aquarius]|uniref:Phage tail protein n=1 Tax=Paragemmobacter aquarius TaxID=2169400 RepID=A0A2S0UM55_9RHOB|nr:hypothetical protein [Gemmobacter aquarius]AWB48883.1 hypothetical protein HYN69_10550 [Gemmobacter aquarius]